MIIGEFTYDADTDVYTGSIRTMTVTFDHVSIRPYDEFTPASNFSFGVSAHTALGFVDCGEARRAISEDGTRYLEIVLDDPAFAKPITAYLPHLADGTRAGLGWDRPRMRWLGLPIR